jgi:hypothetical protein
MAIFKLFVAAAVCSLVREKTYTPSIYGSRFERLTINAEFCGLTETFREWNKIIGE